MKLCIGKGQNLGSKLDFFIMMS